MAKSLNRKWNSILSQHLKGENVLLYSYNNNDAKKKKDFDNAIKNKEMKLAITI